MEDPELVAQLLRSRESGSGEEVFKMGLRPDYPGGVVIDPFGPEVSFAMGPEQIAWMYANTRPRP